MVQPALRAVLVAGDGAGVCSGDGVRSGRADHPVCGDEVELSVRMAGQRLLEVRWLARGCPAAMAVAALCSKALANVEAATAPAALQRAIVAHGGLAATERHAEALVLRALAEALRLPEALG
jgi:NifU-like protein involved in Fe-S cluster formation